MTGIAVNRPAEANALEISELDADGNVTSGTAFIVIGTDAWLKDVADTGLDGDARGPVRKHRRDDDRIPARADVRHLLRRDCRELRQQRDRVQERGGHHPLQGR